MVTKTISAKDSITYKNYHQTGTLISSNGTLVLFEQILRTIENSFFCTEVLCILEFPRALFSSEIHTSIQKYFSVSKFIYRYRSMVQFRYSYFLMFGKSHLRTEVFWKFIFSKRNILEIYRVIQKNVP